MSGEQLNAKVLNKAFDIKSFTKSKKSKVNINELLLKVRKEKNKEKKENYIFLTLICLIIGVTGIIASL
tara:strand:+ start:140 stop:346 length:207 start_codon:yes stop_codon:yes gene_type:complete